jgi:hypothetical protein
VTVSTISENEGARMSAAGRMPQRGASVSLSGIYWARHSRSWRRWLCAKYMSVLVARVRNQEWRRGLYDFASFGCGGIHCVRQTLVHQ